MWVFTALARSSEGAVNQGKAWANCAAGGKQTECSLVPTSPVSRAGRAAAAPPRFESTLLWHAVQGSDIWL